MMTKARPKAAETASTDADDVAARRLAALGNPVRLKVLRLLVQAGPDGLIVGDIQAYLGIPASTLAHHLTALARAGLIDQTRRGRETVSTAAFQVVRDLADFLVAQCCAGLPARSTS